MKIDTANIDYGQTPDQLQEVIANAIFKISADIEDAKAKTDIIMNSFYYEISKNLEQRFNVPPWERTDDMRNN